MSLKTIATLLLCIGSINSLSAAPLLKNLIHPKSALKQKIKAKEGDYGYTDFSGVWESAKCMGGSMTLAIENSDEFLSVNGEEMTIGTLDTHSNSGIKSSLSTTTFADVASVEWNADKTQLMIKAISIEKSFNDPENPEAPVDTAMNLFMNHVTLEMDNGKLKLKLDTAEYKDLQRVDTAHPTCVFTKSE